MTVFDFDHEQHAATLPPKPVPVATFADSLRWSRIQRACEEVSAPPKCHYCGEEVTEDAHVIVYRGERRLRHAECWERAVANLRRAVST
jgi:hypothetical protein